MAEVPGKEALSRELQEERDDAAVPVERSQKMKQENQVLLKKLHDVVGRYRKLQSQHQTLVEKNEMTTTTTAPNGDSKSAEASPTNSAADGDNAEASAQDAVVKKLETEKHELIEKLKNVVGTCRAMQKQLQEAKEENEALKSPGKPLLLNADSDDRASWGEQYGSMSARIRALEDQVSEKDTEKEELAGKLKEVVKRYQGLQVQLEEKDDEIARLTPKLEKLTAAIAHEEAMTALFREENVSLKDQLGSLYQDQQHREDDHRVHLELIEKENTALAAKTSELERDIAIMRKEQDDSEQLYLEVASKLNQTLRENGQLHERILKLQEAAGESQFLEESQRRVQELEEQVSGLMGREEKLVKLEAYLEAAGIGSTFATIEDLISTHTTKIQELQLQINELNEEHQSAMTVCESRSSEVESLKAELEMFQEAHKATSSDAIQQLEAALREARENAQKSAQQVSEFQRRTAMLQSDLDSTRVELASQTDTCKELKSQLDVIDMKHETALMEKDQEHWAMLSEAEDRASERSQRIQELQQQLETLQTQISENEEGIAKKDESIAELQVQVSSMQSDNETLRSEYDSAIERLQEFKSDLAEARHGLEEYKLELSASQQSRDAIKTELAETQHELEDYKAAVLRLEDSVSERLTELDDVRTEQMQLRSEYDALCEQRDNLSKEHADTVTKLQHQVNSLLAEQMERDDKIKEFQTTEQARLARIKELEEEVQSVSAALFEARLNLDNQLLGVTDERDSLAEQLGSMQLDHEKLVAEQERLTVLVSTYEEEWRSQKDLIMSKEAELSDLVSKCETLEADCARLQEVQTERDSLSAKIDELESKLREHESELSRRGEELRSAIKASDAQLSDRDVEIDQLRGEKTNLESQVIEWKTKFEEKLGDADGQVAALTVEITALRTKIQESEIEIAAYNQKIAEYDEKMDAISAKFKEDLHQKDSEHEHLVSELNEQAARLQEETDNLRSQLESSKNHAQSHSDQIEHFRVSLRSIIVATLHKDDNDEEHDSSDATSSEFMIEQLRSALQQARENEIQAHALSGSLDAIKEKLESAQADVSLAETRAEQCEAEIQSLNDSLQATKDENGRVLVELEYCQTKLTESEHAIEELNAALSRVQEEKEADRVVAASDAAKKVEEMARQLSVMESEMEAIRAENVRMVFEVAKTTDSGVKLQQDFDSLQQELQSKTAELEHQIGVFQDLSSEHDRKTKELEESLALLDGTREELATVKHESSKEYQFILEQLEASTQTLDRLQAEFGTTQEQQDTMKQQLEESEDKRRQTETLMEEQMSSFSEKKRAIEEKLRAVDTEKQALADEILRMQTEFTQQTNELETHLDLKTSELRTLHSERDDLVSQNDSLNTEIADLKQEIEAHQTTLDVQSSEVEEARKALRTRIKELEKKIKELEKQAKKEQAEKEKVEAALRECEEKLEAATSSSDESLREAQAQIVELTAARSKFEADVLEFESRVEEADRVNVTLQAEKEKVEAALRECEEKLEAATSSSDESLREAQAQIIELTAARSKLEAEISEFETRIVTATTEVQASKQTTEALEVQVAELKQRNHHLENQFESHASSIAAESTAEVVGLQQKVDSLTEELSVLRASSSQQESQVAQRDEIISKLKSKLEEVVALYKKLKEHAKELQDRYTEKSEAVAQIQQEAEELKVMHESKSEELGFLRMELTSQKEQFATVTSQLKTATEQLSQAEQNHSDDVASLRQRVATCEADLVAMRNEHALAVSERNELIEARKINEVTWNQKIVDLETHQSTLVKQVQDKEAEGQEVLDKMRELLTRYRELQEEHAKLQSSHEETRGDHDTVLVAVREELNQAKVEIAQLQAERDGVGVQYEETQNKLQAEVASLRAQLDIEIEGADAARAALETYKKRAATALKKATSESKLSVRKIEEETSQLQQDVADANARIEILQTELSNANALLDEVRSSTEDRVRVTKEQAQKHHAAVDAAWKDRVSRLEDEINSLRATLQAKAHLDERVEELNAQNDILKKEIEDFKDQLAKKSDLAREMLTVKDSEITDLKKRLEVAIQEAKAAAAAAKAASDAAAAASAAQHTSVHVETVQQSEVVHEEHHLSAAVAEVRSIPLASTSNGASAGADAQILKLARAQALRDEEAGKMKKQLSALDEQVRLFQKKYEDTLALLEETNRQKKRLQELNSRSSDGLNLEYLKNVVIKYIESQNHSEKERLIPVIATVLHFSPQEMRKISDAHQRAQEESGGLLGGMFSLFGAATSTPPPKPLAIPANLNPREQTTGMIIGGGPMGGDQDEDDDSAMPLNPFAANY